MFKKIFIHSFLYSISTIVIQSISLLLLPFLTPYLTATDFGIYGVITSYLFFVTAIKDLGFNIVYTNTFYKHPKRWPLLWRMFYGHLIYWSFFYFLILIVLLYLAVPSDQMHNFPIILLLTALPYVFFDSVSLMGNYYFRFTERPGIIALVTLSAGILSLGTLYYCVVVRRLGYMSWFYSNFVSSVIIFSCYSFTIFFRLKLWPILQIRRKFITPYLKIALPMIPHNYSSYLLNSSDRVVMNIVNIPINKIGLYNAAYKFGNFFDFAGEAIGMAVSPQFVKLYTEGKKSSLQIARNLTFILLIFFLTVTFIVSIWLKEIFLVLFRNAEMQTAYSIGVLIIMGYAYRPMYWSSIIKLSTNNKTNVLWRISFVAGVLNVILNFIFLKQFGIYAAAINTLISLLYIGFAGFYTSQYKKLNNLEHYPIVWILLILLFTLAAFLLKDITWQLKIVLSLSLLIIAFVFSKFILKFFTVTND